MLSKFNTRSDVNGLAKSIIEIKEICDKYGLFFWFNYGGLLGMIRDKRLLPWNNDLEVCCWHEDVNFFKIKKIVNALNKLDYTCIYYKSFGTISIKKGTLIDININCYWKSGDMAVRPHETASKYEKKAFLASVFYWVAVFIFIYPNTFKDFKFIENNSLPSGKNLFKFLVVQITKRLPSRLQLKIYNFFISASEKFGGRFEQTAIPVKYFESFKLSPFYGSEMYFPENPETLLEFIYGKEWEIPLDKYSFYNNKNKTGIKFLQEKFDYNMSLR